MKVIKGVNDLNTRYPLLSNEFDSEKNAITSDRVYGGGDKKYWWICPLGHSYLASINKRVDRGNGCPYCSGHRVMPGFNDICTTNPELLKEWDYNKNEFEPSALSKGSSTMAFWLCSKGHSYKASVLSKTQGKGCPICSNRQVLKGYNDLATTNPSLAKEWHPTKNGNIKPSDVFEGTATKYWWLCSHGHEWMQSPHLRSKGRGCPVCSNEIHVSFPEKVIYFYVKNRFSDTIENYNPGWKSQRNIDIFIPSLRLGIEYDGGNWHKNLHYDEIKNKLCKDNDIKLVRIREEKCPFLRDGLSHNFIFKKDDYEGALSFISNIIYKIYNINIKFDINLIKDRSKINELVLTSEKKHSIVETNPKEMLEWDYVKNGSLKPEFLTRGSTKKVWWKCSKGHSWQASISNRCTHKRGCPYCNNTYPVKGVNDFLTCHPNLCKWWDYSKNKKGPEDYVSGSGISAFWVCPNGHVFSKSIRDMVKKPCCPECKKIIFSSLPEQYTIKQHYVPVKYLGRWSDKLENVWCSVNEKAPVPIKSICFKKSFYKIESITEEEFRFIYSIINDIPNVDILPYVNILNQLLLLNSIDFNNTEFEKEYNNLLNEYGERIQTLFEKELTSSILNSLYKLDSKFLLNKDRRMSFNNYLFYQYFRTLTAKNKLINNLNCFCSLKNIRFDVVSKILCNFLPPILSFKSLDDNYKINFLINNTSEPFITSDNPVFLNKDIKPNEIDEFLFVVSPTLCIIYGTALKDNYKLDLSLDQVIDMNKKIKQNSFKYFIAINKDQIEKYK